MVSSIRVIVVEQQRSEVWPLDEDVAVVIVASETISTQSAVCDLPRTNVLMDKHWFCFHEVVDWIVRFVPELEIRVGRAFARCFGHVTVSNTERRLGVSRMTCYLGLAILECIRSCGVEAGETDVGSLVKPLGLDNMVGSTSRNWNGFETPQTFVANTRPFARSTPSRQDGKQTPPPSPTTTLTQIPTQSSESRLYTFSPETKTHLRKFRLSTSRAKDPQAIICTPPAPPPARAPPAPLPR